MAELTEEEYALIARAASRVVGSEQWDKNTGPDLRSQLRLALTWVTQNCHDYDDYVDVWRMLVLLHLVNGDRYDLRRAYAMDAKKTVIRKATVAETIEAMFAATHLHVDGIYGQCEVAIPC